MLQWRSVKIAICLELIKFGQIVKESIFKLGKTKFDSCVLIWFLIFCYAKVFVIVDQFLIFWQCLTTLCLSVVKNINGVCKFLLLFFLWRPVVDNLRLQLCLFASQKTVFASI